MSIEWRDNMEYYMNEYSLRGQFSSLEEFYQSLLRYTLPVLKKIETVDKTNSLIWKNDMFWDLNVCNDIKIGEIRNQKGRSQETQIVSLKNKLIKLVNEGPFWSELDGDEFEVLEYKFDKSYQTDKSFPDVNCFTKAAGHGGVVISFSHDEYKKKSLELMIDESNAHLLGNIFSIEYWDEAATIEKWKMGNIYVVEVRAKEPANHNPHFHVTSSEYSASVNLLNGKINGCSTVDSGIEKMIQDWYQDHAGCLKKAWNRLHPGKLVN